MDQFWYVEEKPINLNSIDMCCNIEYTTILLKGPLLDVICPGIE